MDKKDLEEEKKRENVKIDIKDLKNKKFDKEKYKNLSIVKKKELLYEPDDEFELKSCCGSMCQVDKPFMEFLAKTIVSLSVLGFCFIQLSKGSQSEFASSTISLILGTYLGAAGSMIKDKGEKKK